MTSKTEIVTAFADVDPASQYGNGISRPAPKARTRTYRVEVILDGDQKMIVTMPAESKKKAQLYAQNRWPSAKITVKDQV